MDGQEAKILTDVSDTSSLDQVLNLKMKLRSKG